MQDIIERFVSPSGGQLRAAVFDGEPWFVAKDVAKELGYINTAQMTRWLDDDEFIKLDARNLELHADCACNSKELPLPTQTGGNSGTPMMVFISESGLYHAALRSRMPKAKAFRRWVTHEVLPSLRKHGAYLTPKMERNIVEHPEDAVALAKTLREERERREFVEADRDKLKAKCDKLVREKSWISSSREAKAMSELSIQYGIIRRLKDKVGCLERELKDERKEKEVLRLKLDDAKRTIDDLQRKYEDAMRKIEELLPDAEAYRRWLEAWKNGMRRWHDGLADPGQGRLWDDDREIFSEEVR